MVSACPAIATQRIGTSVRRLIRPKPVNGSLVVVRLVSVT
jgi:hypothetical protein